MEFKSFFTEIKFDNFQFSQIEANSILAGIGSCFAEKFLGMLSDLKMSVAINPSGIIYNLYSMSEIIERIVKNHLFSENEVDFVNNRYILWSHHGSFGAEKVEDVLQIANQTLIEFRKQLLAADYLVLTPSSSVVYRHLKHDRIVANCHKENNNSFRVELLSANENSQLLSKILQNIREFNPKCKVIVSVSPIRHYPGDLILNSRSKANLLSGIHETIENNSSNCIYFPAYEIVHDVLRDYRFYGKDMFHLSEVAESYVFQKFITWAVSSDCQKYLAEVSKQQKFENHRPKYTKPL